MVNKFLAATTLVSSVALATAGCGQSAGAPPVAPPAPRTVKTVVAEQTTVERTTTQPATIHAFHQARILAKTSGYLAQLNVDIGSRVKAGDPLAVIDVPEMVRQYEREEAALLGLQAAVMQAEAQISVAHARLAAAHSTQLQIKSDEQKWDAQLKADESEHARVSELVKQKAVAERLLDEARSRLDATLASKAAAQATTASAAAQVEVAKAEVLAAEAELKSAQAGVEVGKKRLEELKTLMSYAELRAPFDGVVVERHVEPGDLVRNSQTSPTTQPLFVIAQLDRVRVRITVPERDAPLATVGDNVHIAFQALPGEPFTGPIARIAAGLDQNTRTMLVEVDLPNPHGWLIPGMFGQATIQLETRTERVVLPAGAVRYDSEGTSYVYVVDQNQTIQVRNVETGVDDGLEIEITSGLSGGERVVGPLLHRLSDGQQVRVEG